MPPEIPSPDLYKLDSDSRLQVGRGLVPEWLRAADAPPSFFVPMHWKRCVPIPPGHDLEAWIAWSTASKSSNWAVKPSEIFESDLKDEVEYVRRSLMFPVRFDSKERLCCAGLFSLLARLGGSRTLWVTSEKDSISIWTNFAFQAANGPVNEG